MIMQLNMNACTWVEIDWDQVCMNCDAYFNLSPVKDDPLILNFKVIDL